LVEVGVLRRADAGDDRVVAVLHPDGHRRSSRGREVVDDGPGRARPHDDDRSVAQPPICEVRYFF
jgi:hypothetical protein